MEKILPEKILPWRPAFPYLWSREHLITVDMWIKKKRRKSIEIANREGYMPNPVAMALQQKKTRQLLFFCGDLTGVYYNQMFHGMARKAEEKGYHVLAIMNERDFEMVKRTLADGILFPTETVAQAYSESIGKNYYLPQSQPALIRPLYMQNPCLQSS